MIERKEAVLGEGVRKPEEANVEEIRRKRNHLPNVVNASRELVGSECGSRLLVVQRKHRAGEGRRIAFARRSLIATIAKQTGFIIVQ